MSAQPPHKVRRAAGCVVYRCDSSGQPLILLVHDKYGRWTLPKGHLKRGESEEEAAAREVREETGITGRPGPLVSRIAYTIAANGALREKRVAFFLMRTDTRHAVPRADEGITAADWFAAGAALERAGYPLVRDVLERALQMIAGHDSAH